MSSEDDFRIRPGRIRSTRAQRARPFIAQALAAAQRAGGSVSRKGTIGPGHRSRFGHGQRASVQANRLITSRSRGAVVKARVVRHGGRNAPLATHLNYLRREGVTRDGEKARLFGPGADDADRQAFAERCTDDRHHFRFIVSPDDAVEMADLKSFTRDLVGQMEKDLGTKLNWVAVDHWNTEHPHVHLIVRGVREDGENLVISRDYIKEGMRDRARDLITQELGPRTDHEIRQTLERQIDTERWTNLDRQAITREPAALGGGGFGAEVREALDRRAEHLIGQGLAERQNRGVSFNRNLIETLRRRELDAVGARLAAESGRPFNKAAAGDYVAGAYQRRIALASGRFAMIDDGLGFQLVPWSPSLEKQLGRHVAGLARGDGGIDWSFGRKRGLGL
ncbi:DUF3363 domain-containing protein [Nitrobacter sp.]|uniref:DUF3363 domain-containing protein n=1 Tax=Nitrobacter sp. TaxID=29420 RepID=UPI001DE073D4|nr:DUF3363 domain-containing protein [Nitrobacter sp.]MCB1393586.1 DUF3363 domain-containing protein [Nitrobacter sp.]MCV0387724.1 DUF3363 domain-containing protein [Nitrobacter sp.]